MTADPRSTVVALTALDIEYAAVRALLRDVRRYEHSAGTIFEAGRVADGSTTVAVAVIGTGNHAAAAITERAISMFRPAAVLFVGIAGALHPDLDLGAVVVATKVYGYHGGRAATSGFRARPQAWEADHRLEQLAREVHRTGLWKRLIHGGQGRPAVHFRPVAAGEVVLNSRETALREQLQTTYEDAAAIEMESAGMAKAAHLNRQPCLTIRGISDKADGRKYDTDNLGWPLRAAENAAAFAMAVAAAVPDPQAVSETASNPTRHALGHPPRERSRRSGHEPPFRDSLYSEATLRSALLGEEDLPDGWRADEDDYARGLQRIEAHAFREPLQVESRLTVGASFAAWPTDGFSQLARLAVTRIFSVSLYYVHTSVSVLDLQQSERLMAQLSDLSSGPGEWKAGPQANGLGTFARLEHTTLPYADAAVRIRLRYRVIGSLPNLPAIFDYAFVRQGNLVAMLLYHAGFYPSHPHLVPDLAGLVARRLQVITEEDGTSAGTS